MKGWYMTGIIMAVDGWQPKYGICVQEMFEEYFPSTMQTIEYAVSSKPKTFEDAKTWCTGLGNSDKPYEVITPFGDQEENFFLNYAENFWIGLSTKSAAINQLYELYELTDQNLQ